MVLKCLLSVWNLERKRIKMSFVCSAVVMPLGVELRLLMQS